MNKTTVNISDQTSFQLSISINEDNDTSKIESLIENFELSSVVEFVDPYDSIWLKIATVGVYLVQILSASVNIAFVCFETQGLAGQHRTLINQLLSFVYGAVRFKKFNIVPPGIMSK